MDVRPMYRGDDYAGGEVVEMLPNARCSVRLNDGRVIVGCIPIFSTHNQWYYPAPGHEVTVYMREHKGEYLLVGFPRLTWPNPVEVIPLTGFDPEGEPEIQVMPNGSWYLAFKRLPPSWGAGNPGAFDDFERQLTAATSVAVHRENDTLFRIERPAANTIQCLQQFLAEFRHAGPGPDAEPGAALDPAI
jgi:hypothetical protein